MLLGIVALFLTVITDGGRARKYWSDLKTKLKKEGSDLSEKIGQLKMQAPDGKTRITDIADTEQLFSLIQSIITSRDNNAHTSAL